MTDNGDSDGQYPRLTAGQTIRLGMRGRCPRCGQGPLFQSYLKIVDKCPVCGLSFHGHDTGDAPVVPMIIVIGGLIVGLALGLELMAAPPLWVHILIWIPLVIVLTLWTLPKLKGITVALQHRLRSTEEDTPLGGI